ncbi:GNAT family N-acetyltransferase [Mumia sp. DW29H23]|uniref:GNAT family N-acetyltransferase n=1 Tax=Mumia sp. DW29H23 TaxID=3421241 RepID=UPI003D69375E
MSSNSPNSPLRVLVIVASTRPGRLAPAVAEWFLETTRHEAERERMVVDVVDLGALALPFLDEPEHPSTGVYLHEHTRAWSRRVAEADAFVVVTPEYNYGMPAVLKNALDFLYEEWAWKPVAFVSYGNTSAGTRSVQMTKQVATTLRMMPIGATVALRIGDSIEDGRVGERPALDRTARQVVAELASVARALLPLHRERPSDGETAGPVDGLSLSRLGEGDDVAELLVLQRCCWVDEAHANDTLALAPLHETLADVQAWVKTWTVWTVRRQGRLVGAVRARAVGSTWEIGRLMVAPDQAGNGIGSWLLGIAEQHAPEGTTTVELFTGKQSRRNIALYERAGFQLTAASTTPDDAVLLTKTVAGTLA